MTTTQTTDSLPLPSPADCEIVLTRTFDAPRELVFQAWTDPAQIAQWWGRLAFATRPSN
jgi:uncharacterized protein YndB with AHSA1/START domain